MGDRKVLKRVLPVAVLAVLALALYAGTYIGVLEPEMRRLAADAPLEGIGAAFEADAPVVIPTGPDDPVPLYERCAREVAGVAVEDLVAVCHAEAPAEPGTDVDRAPLETLRRAAACRRANLPGCDVLRLQRRAGLSDFRDPIPAVTLAARALIGAGEVHLVAGRMGAAEADFRSAYNVGRHLTAGAGDADALLEGIAVRRMACSRLRRLVEQRGDRDNEQRLRLHGLVLAKARNAIQDRRARITGAEPQQLMAAIRVAREHAEPLWRREAALGLVRLTRLRFTDTVHAWLIRRRARAALADLANAPDPAVSALARKALGEVDSE